MDSISLTEAVRDQLDAARAAASGRSARTLHGGSQHVLRQTLLALVEGHGLDEHDNPGEVTLQVLHGRIRLTTATDSREAAVGEYLVVPPAKHAVLALDDSAALLTVVARPA